MYDESSAQRARISKDSLKVEALGAIDELNSFIGIIKTASDDKQLQKTLGEIQRNLLTIGSITAGSKLRFSKTNTKKLEQLIDDLEGKLPVLKNFVVPGGSSLSAHIQYTRAMSRRVERRIVALNKSRKVKLQILTYLNRLSDYFFMLARETNFREGVKEEIWKT